MIPPNNLYPNLPAYVPYEAPPAYSEQPPIFGVQQPSAPSLRLQHADAKTIVLSTDNVVRACMRDIVLSENYKYKVRRGDTNVPLECGNNWVGKMLFRSYIPKIMLGIAVTVIAIINGIHCQSFLSLALGFLNPYKLAALVVTRLGAHAIEHVVSKFFWSYRRNDVIRSLTRESPVWGSNIGIHIFTQIYSGISARIIGLLGHLNKQPCISNFCVEPQVDPRTVCEECSKFQSTSFLPSFFTQWMVLDNREVVEVKRPCTFPMHLITAPELHVEGTSILNITDADLRPADDSNAPCIDCRSNNVDNKVIVHALSENIYRR